MLAEPKVRELINDLVEEEALVIGGLVAVHRVDDDLVWRLVKNLDVIRVKALRRLENKASDGEDSSTRRGPKLHPHPAVEDFLRSVRRV